MNNTPCYWPWVSVVVDSQGWVKPCCIIHGDQLQKSEFKDETFHIDTIDSLEDYLLSDFMIHLRNQLQTKKLNNPYCKNCYKAEQRGIYYRHHQSENFRKFPGGQIKFLEVTASNICNQTCITCNSYFSTKWSTIEHLFNVPISHSSGKNYSLPESGIEKIKEVMPYLEEFVLKGGEPFSDVRNAKMLEHLLDVNPNCRIHFTSNVSLISQKYIDILKRVKNPEQVELHGSLDHIGKKYEWIRGTSFKQTIETVKRLYNETGIVTRPTPSISYFNIMDLKEIKDFYSEGEHFRWFKNKFVDYNHVYFPIEMDAVHTRTQEEYDLLHTKGITEKLIESKFNRSYYDKLMTTIDIMNGIRGFRWQDC